VLHGLERKVLEFIRLHRLFAGAKGILAGLSGGADSTALLHVLHSLRAEHSIEAPLVCAHINHKLRGRASDDDEQFVVRQAAESGLPLVTRAVQVRAYAKTHKLSLETAGRQLRLASFREMAEEQGCDWIATGHQKNDNAETVLHRLRRGTGFRGLAGIRPVRQFDEALWLARPLLGVTRDEIVQYLKERSRPWREDRSNADLAFTRNVIRHQLLPALQRESRRCLVEELSDLAAAADRLQDRIRREAEEVRPKLVAPADAGVIITASGLASLPAPVAVELVRQVLVSLGCGEQGLTEHHYRGILRLAQRAAEGRGISLPGGFEARYARPQIIVSASKPAAGRKARTGPAPTTIEAVPTVIQVPGRTQFAGCEIEAKVLDRDETELPRVKDGKSHFCEYLDEDRVQYPIVVRPRRTGDTFWPLGLAGPKKVGKFLTAAKVPRELRERILIFADREKILWVCPIRIGEQAKVTETTRRVLSLTVRNSKPFETPEEI
jgi:tRNA(Ile)-lysidine synthase